jgi:hypothetical protein
MPIKWTSNFFGVEKHFQRMRVYSIKVKQSTKTEKEAAKLFYSFQKQCFY